MQPVNLFELASQRAQWVLARQKIIAVNIANADTNGFVPSDIAPFKEALNNSSATMMLTDPRHMGSGKNDDGFQVVERERPETPGSTQQVNLENELISAGEVRRAYEMNTSIVKSFNRMILMTARVS